MTMAPLILAPAVRRFLERARVGRLATVGADGTPAAIPICFALAGVTLFTPLDGKPKRVRADDLQRVRNLAANPAAAVVVDRWDEDWRRLGWVHLRGRAELVERGPLHAQGIALLRAKYAQYRAMALEGRPLIVVTLESATHWGELEAPPAPAAPAEP
jgi:PPOX class probable F420-dependent enzyme